MARAETHKIAKAQDKYAQQQTKKNPECCTGSIVLYSEDKEEIKIMPTRCKKWTCKSCAPYKRMVAQNEIRRGHPERHIVLTCRPQPGLSQIEHLRRVKKSLSKLVRKIRRHDFKFEYWATFEFHENGAPHIHILQRGRYISQRYLSQMWCDLTGNYIVSIDRVDNTRAAAAEATKYLTKSAAEVKEKAPRLKVYSKSQNWEIDDPETDPEYDEDTWKTVFLPAKPVQLVQALRFCGADVEDPSYDFDSWTVRGSPEVPDWLNDAKSDDLEPEEYDVVFSARIIMRGKKALEREKTLHERMAQLAHSTAVYDEDRELQQDFQGEPQVDLEEGETVRQAALL